MIALLVSKANGRKAIENMGASIAVGAEGGGGRAGADEGDAEGV